MTDGLAIVAYEDEDREAILAITEAAWGPVFAITETQVPSFVLQTFFPQGWMPRQLSDVADLLTQEKDMIWVAKIDGRIAGFVGLRTHHEDRMGEIYILAVSPHFQRHGVARSLINHSEEVIREMGLQMMMIETIGDDGHKAARLTYEAMGYSKWPVARYFKPLRR